jgi:hypothetical protein
MHYFCSVIIYLCFVLLCPNVELNSPCIGSDRLAAFTMAEPAVGLDRLVGWWITDDGGIEQFLRRRHPLNNRLSILWDDKICTEAICNVQERVLRTTCEDVEFFAEWFDEPGCESGDVENLFWTDGDIWVRPNQTQWSEIRAADAAVSAAAATAELLKTPWVGCDGIKPAWAYQARLVGRRRPALLLQARVLGVQQRQS